MLVLGLVGSRRKWGNSEVLVRAALRAAEEEGATVRAIRLSDLYIQSCNGCMACVNKLEDCRLSDDFYFLIDQLQEADGIVVSAPSYGRAPAGIIKMIADRCISLRGRRERMPVKKAVAIAVCGRADHVGLVQSYLNRFPASLGFQLVDTILAVAPGPSETLLNETNPEAARNIGRKLVGAIRGEVEAVRPDNCCPICFGKALEIVSPTEVWCPICAIAGHLSIEGGEVKIWFDGDTIGEYRADVAAHRDNWLAPTGRWFQEKRELIMQARQPYQELPLEWIAPPVKV